MLKSGFKTKRLIVRPLNLSDYKIWLDGHTQRKPKTYKYDHSAYDPKDFPKSRFSKMIKKYQKMAKEDQVYVFAVFLKSTGQQIGFLDLATIHRSSINWANLGYVVHNNFHGNGFATEFVSAAIKYGFTKLGYKRIEAAINHDNRPSIALAKAVGMKKECTRRQFYFEDGKWVDHEIFVIISKSKKCWKTKPS